MVPVEYNTTRNTSKSEDESKSTLWQLYYDP